MSSGKSLSPLQIYFCYGSTKLRKTLQQAQIWGWQHFSTKKPVDSTLSQQSCLYSGVCVCVVGGGWFPHCFMSFPLATSISKTHAHGIGLRKHAEKNVMNMWHTAKSLTFAFSQCVHLITCDPSPIHFIQFVTKNRFKKMIQRFFYIIMWSVTSLRGILHAH